MSEENVSPIKSTPPTPRKVKNPFDKALISRLHTPICSPGMCKIYKKKRDGTFVWDIDQACNLVPADIVACNSQFEPSPDPHLEKIAEEATERFFSQTMVMPSPLESSKYNKRILLRKSLDSSVLITKIQEEETTIKSVSVQTTLSFPTTLPPELEDILQNFHIVPQEKDLEDDDSAMNGSRRKLFEEQCDSEHTDDEMVVDKIPPQNYETHAPLAFSPDFSQDWVVKENKRTFGTPLTKEVLGGCKGLRNKLLDVIDFSEACLSPIEAIPLQSVDRDTPSSLASASISPIVHGASSDEEKVNFSSPEPDCVQFKCVQTETGTVRKVSRSADNTPNKIRERKGSLCGSPVNSEMFSQITSTSASSLYRSRSIRKFELHMDMSIDDSFHENYKELEVEYSPPHDKPAVWTSEQSALQSLVQERIIEKCSIKIDSVQYDLEETPTKTKEKSNVLSHEISKIRAPMKTFQTRNHSESLDMHDNPLNLEDKNVDFSNYNLNNLTEFSQVNSAAVIKQYDSSNTIKRADSGFNEQTFFTNTSSYCDNATKDSMLIKTNCLSKSQNTTALKEISNLPWMRHDSGFKEEYSNDASQFYLPNCTQKQANECFYNTNDKNKENMSNFKFVGANVDESMSDILADDMTFVCKFSSTPSKRKSRKMQS